MRTRYISIMVFLLTAFLPGWTNTLTSHTNLTTRDPEDKLGIHKEKIQSGDTLRSGFYLPPAQARPHTWWHWMNGNVTREGITADLEAMARVGIGGAQIFNVAGSHGCDIPTGPIDYLSPDGLLEWDAPPGRWTILRLGHTPTRKVNHPAPESGEGLEIDKLSRKAMDAHWEDGIQPILDHLGPLAGKVLNNVLIDSYEAGLNHWTPKLIEEFHRRRSYDPTPFLPALQGHLVSDGPTTARFLWDFRRTVADLFAENYYGHFAELCREHGLLSSTEPYFSAYEGLEVAARIDIPMGEFWTGGTAPRYFSTLKLAASIAHTHGRTLAGAEAFTAGPQEGRWQNYPGSYKRLGDLAWTHGINRFIFHRFAHQPWLDKVPGMTMGQYGFHFDRTNTWWEPGTAWIDYISRSQYLLQSGEFAGDVLCFGGEASPNSGVYLEELKDAGYDYDGCGTDIMYSLSVDDGDILLPSGKRYRLLMLPDTPFQTPRLARKVRELVSDGAAVLGPKPKHTPSLERYPESKHEVRKIGGEVWGKCDGNTVQSNRYGQGQVFSGISPAEVLSRINVPPAVQLPDCLAWIHRRSEEGDVFFVSNQSGKDIHTLAGFRAVGKKPELWDALHGTIKPVPNWTVKGRHVQVPLNLMPDESVFVVFRKPGKPEPDPCIRVEGSQQKNPDDAGASSWQAELAAGKTLQLRSWNNGSYTLHHASGRTKNVEVTDIPGPLKLDGPWEVQFQTGRGAPPKAQFDSLVSWNKHPNLGIRYFSGTATYSIEFETPRNFLKENQEVWLDLGEVEVIAEVRLNGEEPGILWNHPFRMEVSKALRPGNNILEIEVTNLWVNRLIGDERFPDDCDWSRENYLNSWPEWLKNDQPRPIPSRVTFKTWKHWKVGDLLLPSGLIGPVSIRVARLIPLNP